MKENCVWFYEKHLRSYEKSSFRHRIFLPNDNFSEQEFENFNRNELGNEERFGCDNNVEEEI